MHSFGKMLKALPHHSRDRSRSTDRAKSPAREEFVQSQSGETTLGRKKWNLAPNKEDIVVFIKSRESPSNPDRYEVTVSCSKLHHEESAVVTAAFSSELAADVRWFIEDFARLDVLNRERAVGTRVALRKYCENLVKDLELDEIVSRLASDPKKLTTTIYIQIEGDLSTPNSIHNIPWEILEHHAFWAEDASIGNAKKFGVELCVRRKATARRRLRPTIDHRHESGGFSFEVGFSVGTIREMYPTYNILIVAARDLTGIGDDESHFQIARPLYAALSGTDENMHFNVEICRPGTWEAFRNALARQRKGYWNIVHIDLPARNGNLHFMSAFSSGYDPVADYLVAESLKNHEVSSVFLTCNEMSDESTPNPSQALASTFVAEEIPVVISAPWKFQKVYLMLMCSGFYQSLLILHRKGPAYAVHAARTALQNQDVHNTGRYHVPVKNGVEGLGVIVYDTGSTDKLDASQFCYPNADKTPKLFGIAYQDLWLFGRDLDITKIEQKLLWKPSTSNILWLTGKKGVGISTLLRYLTYWWSLTKFINVSLYLDLSLCMDDLAGILAQMVEVLPGLGFGTKYTEKQVSEMRSASDIKKTKIYKDMVKVMRNNRSLLYFDNVAQWRPKSSMRTPESQAVWTRERDLLLGFVEEIRGGLGLVLLVCPYNDRSICGTKPVYQLDPLKNHDVQNMYSITDWDTWVPGSSSISTKQTNAEQETSRVICEFHDALVNCSQGLMGARRQFIYNLPFNTDQRTRDIFVLLHTNKPQTTGPYNMEDSMVGTFIEGLYDILIRDREEVEDKSPEANPNILPLLFTLSTFFERVPKDVDFYLVLLWYYGLFTEEWALPGEQFDHTNGDQDVIISPEDLTEQMAALKQSPILAEWNRIIQILTTYDYVTSDSNRPDEYFILNPQITFAMRKIVYATEGPLTTPILPVAVKSAGRDFLLHRYTTMEYGENLDANCRLMLEKNTFWSQAITLLLSWSPTKISHFLHRGPLQCFMTDKMTEETTSASDRRVMIYIYYCVTVSFDAFLNNLDIAKETEFLDSEVFFHVWKLAFAVGERLAHYHNAVSHNVSDFNEMVLYMRRCKAFGKRYDESRREDANMSTFDASLDAAEEVRDDLISLGLIVETNAENDTEAPPAYASEGAPAAPA